MHRKIFLLIAALIVPGGLVALAFAVALRAWRQSSSGRKVMALARRRIAPWSGQAAA